MNSIEALCGLVLWFIYASFGLAGAFAVAAMQHALDSADDYRIVRRGFR